MHRVLAVDIGGTKTSVGVVDSEGALLAKETAASPLDSFESALGLTLSLARAVIDRAGPVEALGMSLPGIVDTRSGLLLHSPSSGWKDAPFGEAASAALGLRARCDNDVNACALAEARFGAGRGLDSFFWFQVSTGIGGAVYAGGGVMAGARGMAGEIGHLVVVEGGAPCGCGNRGCLEAEAAGPAWRRRALALLEAGDSGFLATLPRAEVDARSVAEGARRGDPACLAVVGAAGACLARGVAALSNILDPEAIIMGGGVAAAFDLLSGIVEREAEGLRIRGRLPPPRLLPSALGYDAALLGAAALALQNPHDGA